MYVVRMLYVCCTYVVRMLYVCCTYVEGILICISFNCENMIEKNHG